MELKILFIGDVVGNSGMAMLEKSISYLKLKYSPDFIIINGENTRNGKGLSEGLANKYFQMGVDVITSGNHIWDYAPFHKTLSLRKYDNILRPYNYPSGVAGVGYCVRESSKGISIGVCNIQGRTFMPAIDCPFEGVLKAINILKRNADIIFVDFHAEATAEKIAMAWWLDGKISCLVGTHTHVQTADERIFPKGTGYITDAGMTGSFNSVLGMSSEVALNRFRFQTPFRYEQAEGDLKLNGVLFHVDTDSKKTTKIERILLEDDKF